MIKCLLSVVVLFELYVTWIAGKILTRCELVKELRAQGFPEEDLNDWVCLVEHESYRNTELVRSREDGVAFGLFQLTEKYWCGSDSLPERVCDITCADMLLNNIAKASQCAYQIQQSIGFISWSGWVKHCQGVILPDLTECDHHTTKRH